MKAFFGRSGSVRIRQFLPCPLVNGRALKNANKQRQGWHLVGFEKIEGLEIGIWLVFIGKLGR